VLFSLLPWTPHLSTSHRPPCWTLTSGKLPKQVDATHAQPSIVLPLNKPSQATGLPAVGRRKNDSLLPTQHCWVGDQQKAADQFTKRARQLHSNSSTAPSLHRALKSFFNITRPTISATFAANNDNNNRWPNHSLLPTQLLDRSTHKVLTNHSIAFPALEYGPDHGDPRLRKHLASWLTKFFKPQDHITVDRIAISGGASQNLAVLLNVFTDPSYTRNVWFVAPAYHLSFRVFQDAGFHDKFRAIPEDDEGIDIDYLKEAIQASEEKAIGQGIKEPVSDVLVTFWLSCSRTTSIKLVLIEAYFDRIVQSRWDTDGATRNTNLCHALGPKCTNMSSTPCQPFLTPHPKQ
jgi:hypothetical protein